MYPFIRPILLAGGIIDTANALVLDTRALVLGVAGLIAIFIVISIGVASKSIARTVLAGVTAAFILFLVNGGLELFSGQIGEQVNSSGVLGHLVGLHGPEA